MFFDRGVEYKTPQQIALMWQAGQILARTLDMVCEQVAIGVTGQELDEVARQYIAQSDARASFYGYEGYPAHLCCSVNDAVIHGIPNDRGFRAGDIVSIDCGVEYLGWHADAARTVIVPDESGRLPASVRQLNDATRTAMWDGIAAMARGRKVTDIGNAIELSVSEAAQRDQQTYGIVTEYVGHGIGSQMHQDPDVPNFSCRTPRLALKPGICLAIEPMITLSDGDVSLCEDDWTVVTEDGSVSAHWENSVAVMQDGIVVLTELDGGARELAKRGIALGTVPAAS